MRGPSKTISATLLLTTLLLPGCGSATTTTQLAFKSTAFNGTTIPAQYTCDGKNIPPPLQWGTTPPGTGQLALFILGIHPRPATNSFTVSVEWAVAGLDPQLHKLTAGELPQGAYLGLRSNRKRRYSLCPPKGTTEQYQFELFAVPATTTISHNFIGEDVLGSLNNTNTTTPTAAHGIFDAIYTRK